MLDKLKFWFYVFRFFLLIFVLIALIRANILAPFYQEKLVFSILVLSGGFLIYLIVNNALYLRKLYLERNNTK